MTMHFCKDFEMLNLSVANSDFGKWQHFEIFLFQNPIIRQHLVNLKGCFSYSMEWLRCIEYPHSHLHYSLQQKRESITFKLLKKLGNLFMKASGDYLLYITLFLFEWVKKFQVSFYNKFFCLAWSLNTRVSVEHAILHHQNLWNLSKELEWLSIVVVWTRIDFCFLIATIKF